MPEKPVESRSRHVLPWRWLHHATSSILADDGWILLGKLLVVLVGLAGLLVTIITYQSSTRAALLDWAQRRLDTLRTRLQSTDAAQRAHGLAEIPDVIEVRAHRSPSVSPFESVKILFGFAGNGDWVLLSATRTELLAYLQSRGLEGLSDIESVALFRTFHELDHDGWVSGTPPRTHAATIRRLGLAVSRTDGVGTRGAHATPSCACGYRPSWSLF